MTFCTETPNKTETLHILVSYEVGGAEWPHHAIYVEAAWHGFTNAKQYVHVLDIYELKHFLAREAPSNRKLDILKFVAIWGLLYLPFFDKLVLKMLLRVTFSDVGANKWQIIYCNVFAKCLFHELYSGIGLIHFKIYTTYMFK